LVYLTTRVVQPIGRKKKLNPETAARAARAEHILWRCAEIAARHVPNIQNMWHQTWPIFEVHSECILLFFENSTS